MPDTVRSLKDEGRRVGAVRPVGVTQRLLGEQGKCRHKAEPWGVGEAGGREFHREFSSHSASPALSGF